MTRRSLLALIPGALFFAARSSAQAPAPTIQVLKDPSCGCCGVWVTHLQKAGFTVKVDESADVTAAKNRLGVPAAARSCHTGTVGRYVLEGHVPAAEVKKLLATRPDVVGLAVPGMPIGSPGMEVASGLVQPFDVLSFDKAGRTAVFARYGRS